MDGIYRRDYSIRYDEVDLHNRLTPLAIFNCCQDAASRHTRRLGVSLADLRRQGITWVLSRFRLVIDRYPRPGTIVTVTTWPSIREGYFTCREFTLTDPEGAVWGRGTSSWAAIDLESRRPVRLDDRRLPTYPMVPERAVDDSFATLPRVERVDAEVTLPVMRRDLDQNLHVNSSVYLEWGLEVIPDELYTKSLPMDLAMNFRSEAFAGETIHSRMQMQEGETPTCVHQIAASDGRELARLVTVWGKQELPPAVGSRSCPSSAL